MPVLQLRQFLREVPLILQNFLACQFSLRFLVLRHHFGRPALFPFEEGVCIVYPADPAGVSLAELLLVLRLAELGIPFHLEIGADPPDDVGFAVPVLALQARVDLLVPLVENILYVLALALLQRRAREPRVASHGLVLFEADGLLDAALVDQVFVAVGLLGPVDAGVLAVPAAVDPELGAFDVVRSGAGDAFVVLGDPGGAVLADAVDHVAHLLAALRPFLLDLPLRRVLVVLVVPELDVLQDHRLPASRVRTHLALLLNDDYLLLLQPAAALRAARGR